MSKFKKFINDNLVLIVMIPGLIGMHWGWNALQNVESLVSKSEKRELPVLSVYEHLKEKVKEWGKN